MKKEKIKQKKSIQIPVLKPASRTLLYLATLLLAGVCIWNAAYNMLPDWGALLLYACTAAILAAGCLYATKDITRLIRGIIRPGIQKNAVTNRLSSDYRYRTLFFSKCGFVVNTVYAVFNGVVAVISRSAWYGALAVYYILLGFMRFEAIRYTRTRTRSKTKVQIERKVYRRCGVLFFPMSLALGGAVFLMVHFGNGRSYPGLWIYSVAAYTFWKITISIINLARAGKTKSPLLMALRNIGYIDALVSMLSLQTAMFLQFSTKQQQPFITLMNTVTGVAVCLMVLALGIGMIYRAGHEGSRIPAKKEDTEGAV